MNASSFNNSEYFKGYGVIVGKDIVWLEIDCSLSLAELVRDRDYPSGNVIFWTQKKTGSDTVYKVISDEILKPKDRFI